MQQGMTSLAEVRGNLLLSEYVASFRKLNEMWSYAGIDPFVRELAVTEPTQSGRVSWRPRRQDPPSFEALVQSTIELAKGGLNLLPRVQLFDRASTGLAVA
jgi:hypothetical protein